jgi:hypothetical protein
LPFLALDEKIKILREGSISIQVRTLKESPRPRMRVPNPHLESRFPRRRTQIAMGDVLELRPLHGGVCKEGNYLGERGSQAVLETVATGLIGIENRYDQYFRQRKPVPRRFSSS